MLDFGKYENWDIEPTEVEKCNKMNHAIIDRPIAKSHARHEVICKKCNYKYTYRCHTHDK